MNQNIIINDDLMFDRRHSAWRVTCLWAGQRISVYFHSLLLKSLSEIDNETKFDLEEKVELWLEDNEPEGDEIHIN